MSEQEERRAFDRRHSAETIEITVLTGEHAGGASRAGGDLLWTASAPVLAYIDERGTVVAEQGRLSWLAEEETREPDYGRHGPWIHGIRSLAQYVVRVRRAVPPPDPGWYEKYGLPVPDLSRHFALDEVVARDVHLPSLDARLASRLEPASVTTALGVFELDRSFGHFTGEIEWCGHRVSVSLEIDEGAAEGSETCAASLRRLEQCVEQAAETDAAWRAYAAAELTELAGDWQQDADEDDGSDPEPITAEAFARRIRLSELTVGSGGEVAPYYDDDDLFWGHTIVLDLDPDGTPTDASIAG